MSKSVLISGVAGVGLLLARNWALSERLNLLNDLSCTSIPAPNRRNDNAAQRQRAAKNAVRLRGANEALRGTTRPPARRDFKHL